MKEAVGVLRGVVHQVLHTLEKVTGKAPATWANFSLLRCYTSHLELQLRRLKPCRRCLGPVLAQLHPLGRSVRRKLPCFWLLRVHNCKNAGSPLLRLVYNEVGESKFVIVLMYFTKNFPYFPIHTLPDFMPKFTRITHTYAM
jgi:hypothetical protein